jgi:hypothetical protein
LPAAVAVSMNKAFAAIINRSNVDDLNKRVDEDLSQVLPDRRREVSDYHQAHEPYIRAVAAALAAAGFPNDGGNAEPNDPRDGFVDLDLGPLRTAVPGWKAEQVAVCWQEERGWWLLTVADTTSSDGRFVYDLGVATVAAPSTVVAAVAAEVGLTKVPVSCDYPDVDFPDHVQEDEENPEFEAALAVYAKGGESR